MGLRAAQAAAAASTLCGCCLTSTPRLLPQHPICVAAQVSSLYSSPVLRIFLCWSMQLCSAMHAMVMGIDSRVYGLSICAHRDVVLDGDCAHELQEAHPVPHSNTGGVLTELSQCLRRRRSGIGSRSG